MAAQRKKRPQKSNSKDKLFACIIGLIFAFGVMRSSATNVPKSKIENGPIVAASYKSDLQDEQIQKNTVFSTQSESSKTDAKPSQPSTAGDEIWDKLAQLESGGNWQANTGNGYYGGLQFTASTWQSVGGTGLPCYAPKEEQIMRAKILQAKSGWGQWPACAAQLGLI